MRCLSVLVLLLGVACASPSSLVFRDNRDGFTVARAGQANDIVITKFNTLNGTYHAGRPHTVNRLVASKTMTLEIVNNFGGGRLKAYIQGLDSAGKIVFIRSDGSLYYPTSGASSVPVEVNDNNIAIQLPERGQKFKMKLAAPLTSGRVYFAEGSLRFFMVKTRHGDGLVQPSVASPEDPSSETNWGFVEFTYTAQGVVYANISYVDFVGMILSMSLGAKKNATTQLTKGLRRSAVASICEGMRGESADGRNWKALCVVNRAGSPIRVVSPNIHAVRNPEDFKSYWQGYVNKVWEQFSKTPLTIDTQGAAGKVKCRVSRGKMTCDGDNRSYAKPSARDIWGCDSGTFGKQKGDNDIHLAVIARLCAAFNRSTLLLAAGRVQPECSAAHYYGTSPTNSYSRLVHQHEVDGKGYAFSYDDVNPNGENASGLLSTGDPDILTVYVGEHPS
ncbi:hypothetical protein E4U42_005849 [Claviceps africana]|uniref:GH64 domain-containing protein n=1 Tax=Claviceps africana TaxID=83212 RepID=A0A8K0NJQ6_9HYPO|nr:hypothetical protein E4U42_005849 [Claviceps africana]